VTVTDAPAGPAAGRFEDDRRPAAATGGAVAWAVAGVAWLVIAVQAWIRWIASPDQFKPAPILGPDQASDGSLVALHGIEGVSAAVFLALLWAVVLSPLRRDRRVGLDGMLFVGCFVGGVTDGFLNIFHYLFAWNANAIDIGSWSSFLPFYDSAASSRYAEAIVWGEPMYIYFVLGVAIAGSQVVRALRRRYPSISNATALSVVFVCACAFDFVVENAIIRVSDAYAFPRTIESVTVWAGDLHQFPLYEMVLVGALGVAFTKLRLSALDSGDGRSFVERGAERLRPGLRSPVRWLAIIGFSVTTLFCVYHVPFNWLGSNGHSIVALPSYMQAAPSATG
jgi:hypothetical protein